VRQSSHSFAGSESIAEEVGPDSWGRCRSVGVGIWVGWAGEGLVVVPSRRFLLSGVGRGDGVGGH